MRKRNPVLAGALWPGTVAGLLSTLALAWRGRIENDSAAAPVNAPSQWVWGERALRRNGTSARYTFTGFAVHQFASIFWGVVYARTAPLALSRGPAPVPALRHAAAVSSIAAGVTALAAVVDLLIVPERLTPGFQRRLSTRSLWWVYGSFALGLAAGQVLQPPSQRPPEATTTGEG